MTTSPAGPPPQVRPGHPVYPVLPNHDGALVALVLGIVGLAAVPVLGPVAWVMGSNALKEIDARPGVYANRQHAVAGRVLGIVGTVLLAFFVVLLVVVFFVGLLLPLLLASQA